MKYNYEYESVVSNMKVKASELSSAIIMKHMKGGNKNYSKSISELKSTINFLKDSEQIDLYDINGNSLLKTITTDNIDLNKDVYIKNNNIYLISKGTYGHLNVKYIILKDNHFLKDNELLQNIIFIFTFAFIFMSIIGYFLGKLFLKPILIQRKKLDLFIKDTTHELNTPITALLMSINKKDVTSPNNIKRINLSAKRISEIYNDLTYLFLEKHHYKNLDEIDLKPILENNIEYFKELATKKHITMTCNINDMKYKINKESFTRLTNNIISNAIKYTNINGNINITLNNNKFIVKDDGIGIKEEKQKEIFERFYRATTTNGGFGIGLDIVSSICKEFNIKIKLISKENVGSSFILEF